MGVGRLAGTVTENGTPVSGATVRAYRRDTGALGGSDTTDGSGNYEITGLSDATTYTVVALDPDGGTQYNVARHDRVEVVDVTNTYQYWRIKNLTGTTNSYFETAEIQLLEGVTVRSGGVTPTVSAASLSGNPLSALTDGTLNTTQHYWATATANTLEITFDLGSAYAIDGLKIARYDAAGRLPTAFAVDVSENGSDWASVGSGTLTDPGVNFTLSATATFS